MSERKNTLHIGNWQLSCELFVVNTFFCIYRELKLFRNTKRTQYSSLKCLRKLNVCFRISLLPFMHGWIRVCFSILFNFFRLWMTPISVFLVSREPKGLTFNVRVTKISWANPTRSRSIYSLQQIRLQKVKKVSKILKSFSFFLAFYRHNYFLGNNAYLNDFVC